VNSIKQNISDIESSPRKWKKYLTYILKIWSCLTRQMID
jgi:hypothetical protein